MTLTIYLINLQTNLNFNKKFTFHIIMYFLHKIQLNLCILMFNIYLFIYLFNN